MFGDGVPNHICICRERNTHKIYSWDQIQFIEVYEIFPCCSIQLAQKFEIEFSRNRFRISKQRRNLNKNALFT